MTELTSLAEEIGVSERTLRRAAQEGALHANWSSPRRIQISAAEKSYVRRSWKLFSRLREALRTEKNVAFAALIGSTARGEDQAGSDVDLVVGLREPGFDQLLRLELKLEDALDRRTDVLAFEQAHSKPELMAELVEEGRVVTDRENLWLKLRAQAPALLRAAERSERSRRQEALAGVDRIRQP
jgi:predicted nucleotidyltransferase